MNDAISIVCNFTNCLIRGDNNKMKILPEIQTRRSPIIFQNRPVEQEKIEVVLEAARWAPSSYNHQPWRYIVVNENEALNKARKGLVAGNFWAKQAPILIIALSKPEFDDTVDGKEYYLYDTGQSVMSLALEAEHLGLSTHQMLGFTEATIKKEFAIPDPWRVIVLIALGYEADMARDKRGIVQKLGMQVFEKIRERMVKPRERKSLQEIASFNTFAF